MLEEEGKRNLSGLVLGSFGASSAVESENSSIKWLIDPFSLIQPDSACFSGQYLGLPSPLMMSSASLSTAIINGEGGWAEDANNLIKDIDALVSRPSFKKKKDPSNKATSYCYSSTTNSSVSSPTTAPSLPSINTDGHFVSGVSVELQKICGSGSYATVYSGWSSELGKRFAVKDILLEHGGIISPNGTDETLAMREIELHQLAMHPIARGVVSSAAKEADGSVINLYGYCRMGVSSSDSEDIIEDHLFLIMEFTDHPDLFDLTINNNGMGCEKTKIIFQQLISALEQCHANGVYHRDIKPENVLFVTTDCGSNGGKGGRHRRGGAAGRNMKSFSSNMAAAAAAASNINNGHPSKDDGDNFVKNHIASSAADDSNDQKKFEWNSDWHVRLSDFGLATDSKQCTDRAVGSLPYMSPEAYINSEGAYGSAAADIWSLGVMFFSIRFAKTLWTVPNADEDSNYAAFSSDPLSLKRAFNLSPLAYNLVIRMLDPCPQTRCSLSEVKSLLSRISSFVAQDDDDGFAAEEEAEGEQGEAEDDFAKECHGDDEDHIAMADQGGIEINHGPKSSLLGVNWKGSLSASSNPQSGNGRYLHNFGKRISEEEDDNDDHHVDDLCSQTTKMLIISGKRPSSDSRFPMARSRKDSGFSKSYSSSWCDIDEERMDFSLPPDDFFSKFVEEEEEQDGTAVIVEETEKAAHFV